MNRIPGAAKAITLRHLRLRGSKKDLLRDVIFGMILSSHFIMFDYLQLFQAGSDSELSSKIPTSSVQRVLQAIKV